MQHLLEPRRISDGGDTLAAWLAERGWPAFRARQIRHWLFERRAESVDEMTDLPKTLRASLATETKLWTAEIARHTRSEDGTEKLLLRLADDQQVECVLLRDERRRSICISTQVGCGMGCVFCASGLDGMARNLSGGEIIEQMLRLKRLLPADERLSHLVVMGMGEPLANLSALLPALEVAASPTGLGISPRRITISTVGLPAQIRRLARDCPRYNLAVSLHAPDDVLRRQLIRAAANISLAEVLEAADEYFEASGRRLTFEYVLLARINDHREHAERLAHLLAGRAALVNLIPYNPVAGLPYRTPPPNTTRQFREALEAAGLRVMVRFRKGDRIDAACGQLRRMAMAAPASLAVSSQ
jgi:23S rRNA (adenine2503-C2)-methyltransferase